jgi:phospholipid N-methyltransferase
MSYTSDTPFDNIESSHQYVSLLHDAIEEARREVDEEIAFSTNENGERRKEALQIVAYNLAKLSFHMQTSGRLLNDLRTLRRLLLAERKPVQARVKVAGA